MNEVAPRSLLPGVSEAKSPLLVLVLCVLLTLIWGSTWLAIKIGLHDLPPFTGAGLRFLISGVVMIGLVATLGKREGGTRPSLGLVLAHGLCQFAGNYALVYLGQTVLPSGIVSVLWSVFPLLMGVAGHFFLDEKLSLRQWLGLIVAFAGIVLLFGTDIPAISPRAVGMGALVLLAPLSVAASTTFIKRYGKGANSLALNRDAILLGAVILLVLGRVFEADAPLRWTARAAGSLAYLSLAGTVLTFSVYMWLLRFVHANRLSLISYGAPVIALLLGAWLGDEPLGTATLTGTALVLGGVAATALRLPRRPQRGGTAAGAGGGSRQV